MNEYEECLYAYVMDNEFRELMDTKEYMIRNGKREDAECALLETLTEEQRELFDTYIEGENFVGSLELRHIFHKALVIGVRLSRI